jgi:hypothetical protein
VNKAPVRGFNLRMSFNLSFCFSRNLFQNQIAAVKVDTLRCSFFCLYPNAVSDSVITENYSAQTDSAVGQAQKRKEQSFVLCRVVIPWVACTPTTPLAPSLACLQKWMFQKHFASYL